MRYSTPLSYSSASEASSLPPMSHDRPPPPSQKKMLSLLSFDESPIMADKKSPRYEEIQDIMAYMNKMRFSSPPPLNQEHSLYLPSSALRDVTNDKQNYPQPTPIQAYLERTAATPKQDPIGTTPIKPNENHIHDQSIHWNQNQRKEQPDGNTPIQAKESHLFQASRYYGGEDESQSLKVAWSTVLGSTILEKEEVEEQVEKDAESLSTTSKEMSLLQIHRPQEQGEEGQVRVATPEDAKRLLKTAVDTLQDARAERESARLWANSMKEAVNKWVQEQRKLVRVESNAEFQQQQLNSLSNLEQCIYKLVKDIHKSNKQRQTTEEKMQELLMEQQEKITQLGTELVTMKQQILSEQEQKPTPQQANGPRRTRNQRKPPATPHTSYSSSPRIRRQTKDGGHVIHYGNGVRKEVHKDGTTVIRFQNGDVETKFPTGTTAYFHASENVMQINSNGSVLFEYPNRQIERHDKDGTKTILFADGTKQRISADGNVQTTFA